MRQMFCCKQAAAQQVLEWDEELPRQEAAWRSSQAEAEAALAREATPAALERRRVCARFNLQVLPPSRAVMSCCNVASRTSYAGCDIGDAGVKVCTAVTGEVKLEWISLQAVLEGSSSSRRPKKGQVAVDAWQPADVAKRNVRLHAYMAAPSCSRKLITESFKVAFHGQQQLHLAFCCAGAVS